MACSMSAMGGSANVMKTTFPPSNSFNGVSNDTASSFGGGISGNLLTGAPNSNQRLWTEA